MSEANPRENFPRAGLWRRLFAMLYDSLLVLAIALLGSAAGVGLRVWLSGADAAVTDPDTAAHGVIFQLWLLLLIVGFFVLFWRWSGQTLGMQAWRLQVRNKDGSMLSVGQCLRRLGAGALSWACLGLGYLLLAVRRDRSSWTDLLSDSICVQLPKKN